MRIILIYDIIIAWTAPVVKHKFSPGLKLFIFGDTPRIAVGFAPKLSKSFIAK